MADIRNLKLLYFKGLLFLFLGCLAAGILVAKHPRLETVALLALTIWAFSRAYYFAFYVIEHYIDGEFKFAGLFALVRYVLRRRKDGQRR